MKRIIIILAFSIATICLGFAQNTLTVNNNLGFVANGTTTFTDLQTAIDYASAGDIIYVVGTPNYLTPISYGNININKPLHLVGDGYHADPLNGHDKVTSVGRIDLQDGADGTSIEGLYVRYIYGNSSTVSAINNITIKNNYIYNHIYIKYNSSQVYNGWKIKNNIINQLLGCYYGNRDLGSIQITNNIIINEISYIYSSNPIIAYNIFLSTNGVTFLNVNDATLFSNIFYTKSLDGCARCTFYNNLVYDPYEQTTLTFNYGDNITDGTNIENVDPSFTSAVAGFSWENDYHLQSGSPALTAGTGGTEIGIFSAQGNPFPDTYGPDNPKIKELKIETPLIEPGQQLQIRVKAEN